jgi:uncharacterized repeat protein (TIGR04138 family)
MIVEDLIKLSEKSGKYKPEAYIFIAACVGMASRYANRHITAQELLAFIKEMGWKEYSFLAGEVFRYWGLENGRDFGDIVWDLVENGFLGKNETDSKEDFVLGFDFDEYNDKKEFAKRLDLGGIKKCQD